MYKGRWVPDSVVGIDRGNGMTELVPVEAYAPLKQIETFWTGKAWEEKKPKRNNRRAIIGSAVIAAFVAGATGVGVFFFPAVFGPVFCASVAYLGAVGIANR